MSGLWVEAPIFKGCSLVEPELGALQFILAKKQKKKIKMEDAHLKPDAPPLWQRRNVHEERDEE